MDALTLKVHAATDRGRRRASNEDSHAIWTADDPAERERRGVLLVVADGMGGTRAGGVASQLAVEAVVNRYASGDTGDPAALLRSALERANHVVHSEGQTHAEWTGMGTTCTAVAVRERQAWVAHVGDSRAYLIRDRQTHALTEDHSLVAALVRRREITPDQARSDTRRNVITRSIGLEDRVEVDAGPVSAPLEPGDTLLLCSDGLHGLITDGELAELAGRLEIESVCEELIALANQRGGPDNITVVLARLEPDREPVTRLDPVPAPVPISAPAQAPVARSRPVPDRQPQSRPDPSGAKRGATVMVVLMLALIAALLALLWIVRRPP